MNQESREALVELLFLSLYLDNHLSLAEDEVLSDALDSLGWDSAIPRDRFIFRAFSVAREATTHVDKVETFVIERAELLKASGAEAESLTWLSKVLGADGISPTERYFLDKLEARLYPKG